MNCVNACFKSDDLRGRAISNFSPHPFVIDGVYCKTVEAFIQGIKFPPGDPRRDEIFKMDGVAAWKMRTHAKGDCVWWNDTRYTYRSSEHAQLLERAIRAKFAQNQDAFDALMETMRLTIVHDPGGVESPTTSLPGEVYCCILTSIRDGV